MKVLHVDTAVQWRGGQTQMLQLMAGLLGEQHVALHPDSLVIEAASEIGAVVHLLPRSRQFRAGLALRSLVASLAPDLVAAHTAHAHTACLALPAQIPWVVHRRVDFAINGVMSRAKYGAANGFIAVSDAVSHALVQAGVAPNLISVVYDGVNGARAMVYRGGQGIGAMGALVEHKGHSTLIDAISLLPNATLRIAGEGPLRQQLTQQIADLKLQERVSLIGQVDDPWAFIGTLDAFVHPSKEEGLGQVLIEAMLGGAPIVATTAGGIPELIEHNYSGRLVPPGSPKAMADAIRRVAGDPRATSLMTNAARQRALAEFGVQRMIDETVRAYALRA